MNVAGRKNAALFEWAAFVKAEKEELALLDLFVEYWLQCRIVAGFFLMRFLIMYTLMYTVFSGALVRSHCLHPSRSRCVTMFRLVVLRARIAREIAVPNSDVRKNLRSHMKQPYATGN